MSTLLRPSYNSSPSISNDIGKAFTASPLNLVNYLYEALYARDEIADLKNITPDIDKTPCSVLAGSFRSYNYDYARSMMTVYVLSSVNP